MNNAVLHNQCVPGSANIVCYSSKSPEKPGLFVLCDLEVVGLSCVVAEQMGFSEINGVSAYVGNYLCYGAHVTAVHGIVYIEILK